MWHLPVLDDLHVPSEPVILDGLAYILRNARPNLHLVVASRVDPLLPLHRYRLTGQLAEIRTDDLAFSVPESGLLLAHHGITRPASAVERITGRTEGRGPAGNQFTAGRSGCSAGPAGGTGTPAPVPLRRSDG